MLTTVQVNRAQLLHNICFLSTGRNPRERVLRFWSIFPKKGIPDELRRVIQMFCVPSTPSRPQMAAEMVE
jgi:hypothetical protein